MNHLDNNSCEMEVSTSCCPPKTEKKHCELPENNKSKKDDCCKDISYSDKFVEKQTVKIQKIVPIDFIASEALQIQIPAVNKEENNQLNFLDFYVASNAPPNYILNSQLTFYEG